MRYPKILSIVVILAVAVGIVLKLTSFGVGAPSSLVGTYSAASVPGRSGGVIVIDSRSITYTPSGYTAFKAKNLRWHKYGKYYRIRGQVAKNAYHSGYKIDNMYYRKANQLKYLTYDQYKENHHSFKGVTPFKLVGRR